MPWKCHHRSDSCSFLESAEPVIVCNDVSSYVDTQHGVRNSGVLHTSKTIHETSDTVPEMPDRASRVVNGAVLEEKVFKTWAEYMAME